jgi:hypothetical protein
MNKTTSMVLVAAVAGIMVALAVTTTSQAVLAVQLLAVQAYLAVTITIMLSLMAATVEMPTAVTRASLDAALVVKLK